MPNNENMFADCETAEEAIFQAIGAGSVCWERIDLAGVFESDRAKHVAEQLVERLTEFGL